MPEGPTLRRFCSLVSPFVTQLVVKVGGSTKQIALQDLKGQHFLQCQVHGKNLYLAFGANNKQERTEHELVEPNEEESNSQQAGYSAKGECSFSEETSGDQSKRSCDEIKQRVATEDHSCKWLRFHFGLYGSVRANEFSRARQANKKGDWKDPTPRLIIHFDAEGFLVFYNCRMTWCSSPFSEPTRDILCPEFDKERALQALLAPRPVCITLMDQTYFSGVGNIIKNEILYLSHVHPMSFGSLLPPEKLSILIDHAIHFTADWLRCKMARKALHYHIYMKEYCAKGHQVIKESIGPVYGLKRLTWYCPECQPLMKPNQVVTPI
ncbi:endonuclease 8-like 2 [Discoglossus pictus]